MHRIRARHSPSPFAQLTIIGLAINVLLLIVLLAFSYLREDPLFWTNEGGWPSTARSLVRILYYPLLALEFLLLVALSATSVYLISMRRTAASLAIVLLPMLWGLYFMVIVNSVANNLSNLWNGRPLHWHADRTWQQF